ncbi:WD repeat-containing protein jip5 [Cadophora gregata]|uniref:WD repeat-containing protein jip5 n=1 Tax=Cadophora gregata TaxID=51156 RepID=UPI0026DD13A5|nr:WD repeat-containing protein jip5 [Cadophora gregata]KAK0121568.1 WD repeat-containing protein jip5 [Cadophora gregata]
MFENLCTLPLSSELFTQALHPTEPILAVGLSGGHVESFRLPAVAANSSDDDDADTSVISTGTSTIDTEWRTRRHKGSCRTLAYSGDGEVLYSAGTDGLLKAADSSTGQVVSKILIPFDPSGKLDPPTLIHALTPQTLLLATDSAALHLFDLRAPSTLSTKPSQTHRPHDDYISSLTPLPPTENSTSGFSKQWVTTGGTTLAVTDLRRGVLVKSEDQEEELLSSVFVGGLPSRPGRSKGQKVLVGSSNGVLTLWERGVWDDQDERIIVDGGRGGGESLDALVLMPEGVGDGGKNVVVGVGDGTIRIVKLGPNKVTTELRHDEVEGVVGLGFDVEGRLISGGGSIIKVWQEKMNLEEEAEDDDSDDDESGAKKRAIDGSDDDSDADSSEEEDRGRKSRKKRRKANRNKNAGNGIIGLKGLE